MKKIASAGIPMTSTLAVFLPHFSGDNAPLFRDGMPFPWETIASAGQGPVNARLLWEAGISYGYGTDTSWPPKESLADELRALRLVFLSPFYAFAITLANTVIAIFGIFLLGPSLLYVPTLLALISIQALWGMTCSEIPDLIDPVVYAEQLDQKKLDQIRTLENNTPK